MMAKRDGEFSNGEVKLLSKLSSIKLSDFYSLNQELKDPNSQINKNIWNLIRFYINKEDALHRWIINFITQQQLKLENENEEIIEEIRKAISKLMKFMEEETLNFQEQEETLRRVEQLQQLLKKRSLVINDINQLLTDIKVITQAIVEKRQEIRTLILERDEKTFEFIEQITQERFTRIEVVIETEQDPERKTEMLGALKQLKSAHEIARQYRENLEEILKERGIEITSERVLLEKLIHRQLEFKEEGKKIIGSHLLPTAQIRKEEKNVKDFMQHYDEKIEQKEREIFKLEKSRDEKEKELNKRSKEFKEIDKELQTYSNIELPKVSLEKNHEDNSTNIQDFLNEADKMFEEVYNLTEMTKDQTDAVRDLEESVDKIKNNTSMSATERLDCLLSIVNSMKVIQKNPILWAMASSFTDKLINQLPEDRKQVFHP